MWQKIFCGNKMASARNVCFTLNNYTAEEYADIKNWDCDYLVVGEEVGKEGTPHLQGYVEWKGSKRFTTMKKLNSRIHWETRKGSAAEASAYCMKDGIFFCSGKISQQGTRSDLQAVCKAVSEGKSNTQIAEEFPTMYLRFNRGINELRTASFTDRKEPPTVEWRWGATGTGKTRFCVDKHTDSFYIKDSTMWWNGYEQQEAIIIDDFDGRWPYRDLLRLLDRYPYQGQYKGGYVKINSPFIYITCEHPPSHFWTDNELAQVTRRISNTTHCVAEVVAEVAGNTRAATSAPPDQDIKKILEDY